MTKEIKTACVFAHFDAAGKIDDYVVYYLDALSQICRKIIFVTTCVLDSESKDILRSRNITLIERDNQGYDFYSYKTGAQALHLDEFDELILCNDSVYGPIWDLAPIMQDMRNRPCDFWGMTESYDIAHHLQSYFLVFSNAAFLSGTFRSFWEELSILNNKRSIIESYEVGLSRSLVEAGLSFQAVASFEDEKQINRIARSWRFYLGALLRRCNDKRFWQLVYAFCFKGLKISVNPTHTEWKSILEHHGVPFIKTELLKINPTGVKNLDEVFSYIDSQSQYPSKLIESHLSRVLKTRVRQPTR